MQKKLRWKVRLIQQNTIENFIKLQSRQSEVSARMKKQSFLAQPVYGILKSQGGIIKQGEICTDATAKEQMVVERIIIEGMRIGNISCINKNFCRL